MNMSVCWNKIQKPWRSAPLKCISHNQCRCSGVTTMSKTLWSSFLFSSSFSVINENHWLKIAQICPRRLGYLNIRLCEPCSDDFVTLSVRCCSHTGQCYRGLTRDLVSKVMQTLVTRHQKWKSWVLPCSYTRWHHCSIVNENTGAHLLPPKGTQLLRFNSSQQTQRPLMVNKWALSGFGLNLYVQGNWI